MPDFKLSISHVYHKGLNYSKIKKKTRIFWLVADLINAKLKENSTNYRDTFKISNFQFAHICWICHGPWC